MTIEAELNKVLKVKQKKGEDTQLYLSRMVTTVQNVSEEAWETLSVAAQRWCNAAAKAYDAKQDIPGFDAEDEEEAPPAKNGNGAKPTAAKGTAKTPAAKAKSEKAAKAPKPDKIKSPSMYKTLKALVIKNPETSIEDLSKALAKAGFEDPKKSTIQTCRSDTRDTILSLQKAGRLVKDMIAT